MGRIIRLAGIDPSMRNFGLAIADLDLDTKKLDIKALELIATANEAGKTVRKNSDDLRRAFELLGGTLQIMQSFKPIMAMVEMPVGSQSAAAMKSCGMCYGILAGVQNVLPLIEVTASEVKMAGYGVKTASKLEMIEWATTKYPDAPWITIKRKGSVVFTNANEHLADAVAAIEAGLVTAQFRQAIALLGTITS